MPPIEDELYADEGVSDGAGADAPLPVAQPPSLPPDISPQAALVGTGRMSGQSALAAKAASNRDRITRLLDKHFQKRERPTAEFADIGAAAGAALAGTPYGVAKQQIDQSNQRGDIALGNAQSTIDQRGLNNELAQQKLDSSGLARSIQLGNLVARQTEAAARTGDRRARMLHRTIMDLAKTTDDPLTASSLAFSAVAEADKQNLILPETWQADVARISTDAITKAGIKSRPMADRSTETDRFISSLTDPAEQEAARRIKLGLQPRAAQDVVTADATGNPMVVNKATNTGRYVQPAAGGQGGQSLTPSQPAQPVPKKVAEKAQENMTNLHATVVDFDRVIRELEQAGPNAVGAVGWLADNLGGLYNQVVPLIGMPPSQQVSDIKAFRSSVQPLIGSIARVLNGPGTLSNEDRRRADQAVRILETSSDYGSVGLALQTLQEVFRKKYENAKALSGPGGQAIEGALGAPPAATPQGETWQDGQYEYRKGPNGQLQRRRLQ